MATEGRQGGRETVGELEERSEQAFDGAEGALDRSLLGRGTFFLGLVLDLESLAGSARGLRIGRTTL